MRLASLQTNPSAAAMPDDSRLWQITGYALRRSDLVMARDFRKHIGRPLSLSEVEFAVLTLLAGSGEVSQKALAGSLGMSAPALTVVLERMARAGLIERERSSRDRRIQLIALTPAGKRLAQRADAAAKRMEAKLRTKLSSDEQATLFLLLDKLRAD